MPDGSLTGDHRVTVVRAGTGTGTVTSAPEGIACGSDCAESYPDGAMVTLTATADASSTFSGWSGGGCSGTSPCMTTLRSPVTITATFASSVPIQRIGHPTFFGDWGFAPANTLFGERIVVEETVTLRKLGVFARAEAEQLQLALYADAGGSPGSLIAHTPVTTITEDNMELDTTVDGIVLSANTYWMVGNYKTGGFVGVSEHVGNLLVTSSQIFGTALPDPLGAATLTTGRNLNYYLVVQ